MSDRLLEQARAITLARQARNTAETIASVLIRSGFMGLQPDALSDSAALVIADHPAYARFHRLVRRLLGASLRLNRDGAVAACLRRTWDLFELDCLFTLVIGLEARLAPGWSFHRIATRHGLLAEVPDGEIWRAEDGEGARWTLHSQQTFRGQADGPGSISSRRRPDFVLARWQRDTLLHWVLLDAKYRVGWHGMADAIAAMHVYRDSLRWHHGGQAMAAAGGYLLVPEIGFGLRRFAEPAYRAAHRFGVVRRDDASFIPFLLGTDVVGTPGIDPVWWTP